MINYYEPKLDLTLLGCGFLGSYHVGALYLLQQIWPHKPYNRICGASCGGLLGALILAGLKLETVLDNAVDIIRQLRAFIRNPTRLCDLSIVNLLGQKLELLLPKNAHELCSNRLGVSLTKLWSFENCFVSRFESRSDLIAAIEAGCFIPLWSGSLTAPKLGGEQFIDGAYSDNSPKFPDLNDHLLDDRKPRNVSISAFAGDLDVSPRDKPYLFKARCFGDLYLMSWNNIIRTAHAMIPFNVETYQVYAIAGHRDMKEYLFRNDLIKCQTCWHTNTNSKTVIDDNDACLGCLQLLERVDNLALPRTILDIFKE